jgi:hypothetical protein
MSCSLSLAGVTAFAAPALLVSRCGEVVLGVASSTNGASHEDI